MQLVARDTSPSVTTPCSCKESKPLRLQRETLKPTLKKYPVTISDNTCLAEMNKELDTLEGKLGPITLSIIIAQKLLLGGVCKLRFLTRGGGNVGEITTAALLRCSAPRLFTAN